MKNNGKRRLGAAMMTLWHWFKNLLTKIWRATKGLFIKQKALAVYEGANSPEEAKIAYGFGIARIITAILLVLLLLVTILFGSGTVSYEKIYYTFKDIGYIKSYGESAPSALTYSHPVRNQSFSVFKNGLCVASDSEIKMFTLTGRMTFTSGSEFTNPRTSVSDEHILIYDQGRQSFALYNSFICVYSEKLDYPIAYADMAKDGSFLVVTSSSSYASVLRFYNSKFELVCEYSKNDRVIGASLSSNGRYAAVLSVKAEGGSPVSVLNVIDTKNSRVISTTEYRDSMPYSCEYLTDDRILVLLDGRCAVVDASGGEVQEYVYPASLQSYDIFNGKFALLFDGDGDTAKSTVTVFDSNGRPSFTTSVEGAVIDMRIGDGYVYFLRSGNVTRISDALGSKSETQTDRGNSRLVVFSDGKVAVCSQTMAKYISFD